MAYQASIPNCEKLKRALPRYDFLYENKAFARVAASSMLYMPTTINLHPNKVVASRWKLLPFWVETEKEAQEFTHTLKAEAESLFDKGSYKSYIQRYRGLLWVDGYFETHYDEKNDVKEDFCIRKADNGVFSLGIVVAPWLNPETNEIINTFSVITTEANAQLEKINNISKRMPLIIPEGSRESWLSEDREEAIKALMLPYQGSLDAERIDRTIYSRM
ncbi:SOS response-associated peptidase family protein [Albibacterium profundi]|uniref:Abasic site processing protein n=1 Tax=Albibacterium profundi TaxID=3134906 RepID=A0ABV5CI00_9SPHI